LTNFYDRQVLLDLILQALYIFRFLVWNSNVRGLDKCDTEFSCKHGPDKRSATFFQKRAIHQNLDHWSSSLPKARQRFV